MPTDPAKILAELERVVGERRKLDDRRDELVRQALAVQPKVPRADIATAADVRPARLYQIRDRRR
jgi:hypothetical protein